MNQEEGEVQVIIKESSSCLEQPTAKRQMAVITRATSFFIMLLSSCKARLAHVFLLRTKIITHNAHMRKGPRVIFIICS